MARLIQMRALALATVNLRDGSILHIDPDHTSDNRARYPRVSDEADADRLEEQNLAERHDGPVPALDTEAARAAETRRTRRAEDTERRATADEGQPKPRVRNRTKAAGGATGGKAGAGRTRARGGAAAAGARGSTAGGPGVETEAEAAAAADLIEGGDPTTAPARGAARRSD